MLAFITQTFYIKILCSVRRSCVVKGAGCNVPKYICTFIARDNNKFLQCESLKFNKSRFVARDIVAFLCVGEAGSVRPLHNEKLNNIFQSFWR